MENLCREDGRQSSQKDPLRDGEMKLHWAAWAASHGRLAPFISSMFEAMRLFLVPYILMFRRFLLGNLSAWSTIPLNSY